MSSSNSSSTASSTHSTTSQQRHTRASRSHSASAASASSTRRASSTWSTSTSSSSSSTASSVRIPEASSIEGWWYGAAGLYLCLLAGGQQLLNWYADRNRPLPPRPERIFQTKSLADQRTYIDSLEACAVASSWRFVRSKREREGLISGLRFHLRSESLHKDPEKLRVAFKLLSILSFIVYSEPHAEKLFKVKKERTTLTFNSRPIGVVFQSSKDAMEVDKVSSSDDEGLGQARRAGIKPGWRLLSVNGESGEPETLRRLLADCSLPMTLEFEKDDDNELIPIFVDALKHLQEAKTRYFQRQRLYMSDCCQKVELSILQALVALESFPQFGKQLEDAGFYDEFDLELQSLKYNNSIRPPLSAFISFVRSDSDNVKTYIPPARAIYDQFLPTFAKSLGLALVSIAGLHFYRLRNFPLTFAQLSLYALRRSVPAALCVTAVSFVHSFAYHKAWESLSTYCLRNVDTIRKSTEGLNHLFLGAEAVSLTVGFGAVYLICPLAMFSYAISTWLLWRYYFWCAEDIDWFGADWLMPPPPEK